MKKSHVLIPLFFIAICVYACSHKTQYSVKPVTNDTTHVTPVDTSHIGDTTHTVDPIDTSVCYQRDILPIFLGSCAMSSCHDAVSRRDGYNLTTYFSIISKGLVKGNAATSKLYKVCLSGSMPQSPVAKLDSTQKSLLKRWIDGGAPNDTNCASNCNDNKFTYSGEIAPMLKSNCNSCHSAAAASTFGGNVILDNYNSVMTQVTNGKLMADVARTAGSNFMPKGGAKLSDCKILQVQKWIAAGAPNN